MKQFWQRGRRFLARKLRGQASPAVDPIESGFPDFSPAEREILRAVQPYTMTSPERIAAMILAVKHIVAHRVPGAVVECGVWRGGSMMAAALTLRALGDTTRPLYLFDTFEGMTEPTSMDVSFSGDAASALLAEAEKGSEIWCHASIEDVRQNIRSTGYPAEQLHLVSGKVENTIPDSAPSEIALLRLDTDWFESTQHELIHLYRRLRQWGVVIVDDYGHWQGARAALDGYLASLPHPTFLHRVDYTGRLFVKYTP
ncbi:MAG: class I SAM-dependent methyltransferase [Verrucomicrobia bacterium]|nr:class I SAM-dependent methyltransferase [Verrucomicrobiota bacterium]